MSESKIETLSPPEAVNMMVAKWVAVTQELGYESPYAEGIGAVVLRAKDGEQVTFHRPGRSLFFSDNRSGKRGPMGFTNTALATYEKDGVSSALHINTDQQPHVLSSKGGEFVSAQLAASDFMQMVLDAEVSI